MPVGQPVSLPDDFGHGIGVELRELLLATDPGHEPGVLFLVPLVAVDLVVEVGLHLEHLREVLLVRLQQVQQHRRPDQNDFDRDGDRFRPKSRRGEAVELARIFDGDLAGLDHPFERIPGKRLAEEIDRVDDQESAVGLQDGSSPNFREVRVHDAQVRPSFDFSDQVCIGRVRLVDDRSAAGRVMLDDQVDLKPAQVGAFELHAGQGEDGAFPRQKILVVLHDVLLDAVQIGGDARQLPVGSAQGFVAALHHVCDELPVELVELLARFFFKCVNTHVKLADLAFQGLAPFSQVLLLLLRQGLHDFVRHGASVLEGHQAESHGRFFEPEPPFLAQFFEFQEQRLLFRFRLFVQLGLGIEIFLALEGAGNIQTEALDKRGHLPFEQAALPGGKGEAGGSRMVLKIIDVTPVRRGRRGLGQPLDHLPDQGALAGADRTRHIDIETLALHLETELQRLHRALLADGFRERFQFAGVGESQLLWVDDRGKHGNRDFGLVGVHGIPMAESRKRDAPQWPAGLSRPLPR